MNNQGYPNQTQHQGGKFCFRCGTALDANGNCPKCSAQAQQTNFSAPQQQSYNPQQQYGAPYNPAPAAPAGPTIFTYALDYIKVFFSSKAFSVMDNISKARMHIWGVLAPLGVLLATLGVFGIINSVISSIMGMLGGYSSLLSLSGASVPGMSSGDNFKIFLYTFLIIAIFFFASAGINTVFFTLQGKKVSYVTNMNILSAAMLPLALCGAVGFVGSYIHIIVGLVMLFAGVIFKYVMLYYGLQKAADFRRSPFWFFVGDVIANMAAFLLIAYIFIKMVG